jgi:hypothetical protein
MKIVLGEFKDNSDELAAFLEPRIGVKPKSSGDGLEIDDDSVRKAVKPRHVKTYIKRYLLKQGDRKHYKILVEGTEITMIYLEMEEDKEKEKEEKKREEERAKREEQSKVEEATPAEVKQAADSEKAAEVKAEARAESKEEEEKEGAVKEQPAKKQRKPRKKSD